MRRLTVSKAELAGACLYWLRDDVPYEDVPNADRETGNAFHELVAASVNGRRAEVWAIQNPEAMRLLDVAREYVQPGDGRVAEVAFAFDPATGQARRLGVEIGRDYDGQGATPGDICGSADLVEIRGHAGPRTVIVTDWKFFADKGDPAKSAQLRALAMMAAQVYGAELAIVRFVYYGDGPEPREVEGCLDSWALTVTIPSELEALANDMAKHDPRPSPGPHCDELHCPARVSCPALRARVEAGAPEQARHLPVLAAEMALDDPAKARAAYDALCAIDALSKAVWARLDEYADKVGPIQLVGGRVYKGWDEQHESIVLDDPCEKVLREAFGPGYKSAIKRSLTGKALEELARAKDASRGLAKRIDGIMASLRVAGSTRMKTVRKHGVK